MGSNPLNFYVLFILTIFYAFRHSESPKTLKMIILYKVFHLVFWASDLFNCGNIIYRLHAIIRRDLYIFYPIFEKPFLCFQGLYLYSRAVCNQEWVIMARVRYVIFREGLTLIVCATNLHSFNLK